MIIRRYETKDLAQILLLFYDTIHNINKADYDEEQLYAWADGRPDPDRWDRSFYEHYSIIAEENGRTYRIWRYRPQGIYRQTVCTHGSSGKGSRFCDMRGAGEKRDIG